MLVTDPDHLVCWPSPGCFYCNCRSHLIETRWHHRHTNLFRPKPPLTLRSLISLPCGVCDLHGQVRIMEHQTKETGFVWCKQTDPHPTPQQTLLWLLSTHLQLSLTVRGWRKWMETGSWSRWSPQPHSCLSLPSDNIELVKNIRLTKHNIVLKHLTGIYSIHWNW